jgi:hypothetical protein
MRDAAALAKMRTWPELTGNGRRIEPADVYQVAGSGSPRFSHIRRKEV